MLLLLLLLLVMWGCEWSGRSTQLPAEQQKSWVSMLQRWAIGAALAVAAAGCSEGCLQVCWHKLQLFFAWLSTALFAKEHQPPRLPLTPPLYPSFAPRRWPQ